ncbi:MAG: hypothetical protein QGF36_04315 [Candidatus Marinimicrobia bacterium]|nr:hypothetical protein [Candidatus Neomarinimicrobiota bacterium]
MSLVTYNVDGTTPENRLTNQWVMVFICIPDWYIQPEIATNVLFPSFTREGILGWLEKNEVKQNYKPMQIYFESLNDYGYFSRHY